ncbi:unnamed protein product [Triticum turgidum subsp. durum]|uniref:F-box protein AT5G49610-like beta-propeller domain-containing protein n=1 Tax=Triticum turgidum subsp. durum TaxID=4567 RepID=A0A9R0XEX3_TRITD|nr:unnamed protein product [Triticum turgidum subsp. durum]
MASQLGPPSPSQAPAKYDPAATTIADIGDDLLREIFLRLPSLPSLVRAALACRTFLRAVRSSPAFRRRFRALHPPQILGYFSNPLRTAIPAFVPFRSRSDPDLAAAVVRGSDFLFTRLPEDGDDTRWAFKGDCSGYVFIHNQSTDQIAVYNPLTQALNVFPYPPQEACDSRYLYFRIIFSEDDQMSFRVVCVRRRRRRRRTMVRFSVFSSDSREWQGFSWVDTSMPQAGDDGGDKCMLSSYTATPVDEFDRLVYWKHKNQAYIVVLNAGTLQLSRMDLPPHLKDMDSTEFELGLTKDGELCMAFTDQFGANEGMLAVWFWRADGGGVDKWMPHKIFPLNKFVDFSMRSEEYYDVTAQVIRVIDGFVYLSVYYLYTKCFLSFCLETEKVNKLFEYGLGVHPYIMPWPSSLVCNKEDLETKVTGENVAEDGPVGTEETPSVLVTALRSYKEALINGDGAKVAEIEAFLLSIEDEKKSLVVSRG